jgi:hypothetical protein
MYLGNTFIVPNISNLPGQSGGGGAFEYTAIDNSFSMLFDRSGDTRYDLGSFAQDVLANETAATISTWYKVNTSNNQVLVDFYDATPRARFAIQVYLSNGIYVYVNDKSYNISNNTVDGNWHHVAAVFDGSGATDADKLKIYLDGSNITGGGYTTPIPTALGPFTSNPSSLIGDSTSFTANFDGYIDEMAIWGGIALSESTIQAIYDTTINNPGKVADLSETPEGVPSAWYRMGD